jgi:hypothetical protein
MKNDDHELRKFLDVFKVRIIRDISLPVAVDLNNISVIDTAVYNYEREEGIEICMSKSQLRRLIDIFKSKGYYHDDDYQMRLFEEDAILNNPDLKRMHDEYKMYLYMLSEKDD